MKFLGLLAVILAGVLVFELTLWQPYVPQTVAETVSAQDPAEPVARLRELPGTAAFASITERPLFNRGRRPLLPAGDLAGAPAAPGIAAGGPERRAEFTELRLVGISVAPNERVALIANGAGEGLERVRVGDQFAGWSIEAINEREVAIRRDGHREALKFPQDIPNPATAAVTPVAAGGAEQRPAEVDAPGRGRQ